MQAELDDPVAGLSAIAAAYIDLVYVDEAFQRYGLIIAEQQHFPELGALIYDPGPVPVLQQMSAYLAELNTRGIIKNWRFGDIQPLVS